jgi:hypothetical protein
VAICVLILIIHAAATLWMIVPTFHSDGFYLHWTMIPVWLGMGGIWICAFAINLKRHPLLARTNVRTEGVSLNPVNAH